ncbi:MAG TPA: hypothetical protein VMY37_27850 [Thermoguttaceae bacterium]|nr:hypothetical protein [Thermoguttaceae bacterium]
MPGQTKTIRDKKTGRLRKMDPSEAAQYMPIESPPLPGKEELDPFLQEFMDKNEPPPLPPKGEPPPLPKAPPPLPAAPPQPPQPEETSPVADAVTGAQAGAGLGPMGMAAGAAIGGLGGFLLSESSKGGAIGSFEGGTTQQGDESMGYLRDLLAVTKRTASVGLPVKDAVTTVAKNSRL